MIETGGTFGGQQVTLSPEVIERTLTPFMDKWRKDFEALLSSLLQSPNTDSSSNTTASSPAKPTALESPPLPSLNTTQKTDSTSGVELARYGGGVGQTAPGTNIPSWVGIGEPRSGIDPTRIPKWDSQVPPGVPGGSAPFYSVTGQLQWLGADGIVRNSRGQISDTTLVSNISTVSKVPVSQVIQLVRDAAEQAGRPLTASEVWGMHTDYVGEPQNPYPAFTETEFVRRTADRIARSKSPYGFAPGKIVPGTALPAWVGWQTPTQPVRAADLPSWDGRLPAQVPAGSVPFYGITGNLQWLAPSGIMYTSQGHVGDTSNVHVMAERKGLSVSEFVTLIQTAVKAAGRPLTLGEMYAGQAGAEDRSLDRVA